MSDSELDSLLYGSECEADEKCSNRHRTNSSGSKSNDYVMYRKPTRIIQYESSEIFYHKSHASSRTTRMLRTFLCLMCLVTMLTVLTYISTTLRSSSRIAILPGWDRNTTRNISIYVQPDVRTTLIEPTNVCDGDDKLLLLIVVCSSPGNFEKRWVKMADALNSSK